MPPESTSTPRVSGSRRAGPFGLLFALAAALVISAAGCATSVALRMDGPTADEEVQVDMQRSEVERVLNESPTSMFQNQGLTEVRYEYSDGPSPETKLRTVLYVGADVFTLFLSELIFWPIELTSEERIKRVALAEYTPDNRLIGWQIKRDSNGETIASARSDDYEEVKELARAAKQDPSSLVLKTALRRQAELRRVATNPEETPAVLELGDTHALVIGNDAYRSLPPLLTARNDAEAVADVLRNQYGYEVKLLTDATRTDILRSINDYRARLTETDNLLIYYAGHGIRDESEDHGYWLPVDADPKDSTHWIANADITRHLKAMRSRHVLVIADSCYSGTLMRGIAIPDVAPGYLRRLAAKRSRAAFTSGGVEPVSDTGSDGHSVFAAALLDTLRENRKILATSELFMDVRRRVALDAEQTPEYAPIRKAGHRDGEFLFSAN